MKRESVALVEEARCIGCTRCIDACPVDCIAMIPADGPWSAAHKQAAKARALSRKARLEAEAVVPQRDRKAVVAAALARRKR